MLFKILCKSTEVNSVSVILSIQIRMLPLLLLFLVGSQK
jgi:hypothetical protein